jgi:pimeloyl-ACP methyl ester carboxylesterase
MRAAIGFRHILVAAAVMAAALFVVAAIVVWRDPYAVVRAEYARERIAAGLSQASVRVAGHRWAYAYSDDAPSDAPTVVMLHGFTGSKENWYPVAAPLKGRYRLLIPDLPGWGQSERRRGEDYGFNAEAERVAAFLRKVSPGRSVVLLGHSMGGGIAPLVAARHPELVSHVGLLAAAGVRFRDNQFGKDVLAGQNPFGVEDVRTLQRYLDVLFGSRQNQPWIPWPVSEIVIARRRHDARFEQSVLDRIGRSDERFAPRAAARDVHQPALLLWCRQDRVIDASAMDLYAAAMPQARKVLLQGCGHMSLMEQPEDVAHAIEQLIEEGKPR